MRNQIRRVREAMRQEYPVRLWQWIAINAAVLTLLFGGIYGVVVYTTDQADAARRSVEIATYENNRDQFASCVQRTESREQIRGAFLDVYDLVDDVSPGNRFTTAARERLDETYPSLAVSDCGTVPTPPSGE